MNAHVSTKTLTGTRPTVMVTDGLDQPLTMSSLEIAELLECRHDSVKRTAERLVRRGLIVHPPMVDEPYVDSMGRPRGTKVYLLDKRSSYIVVAQLSPEFTARVVDRWQELEAKAASQVPQSLPEALRLAADLAEKNAALVEETQRMLPDALVGERSTPCKPVGNHASLYLRNRCSQSFNVSGLSLSPSLSGSR